MTIERLGDRRQLLAGLDRLNRDADLSGMMEAMDSFTSRAVGVITSGKMGQAIGTSNRLGEVAKDRPVHFQEVFATLYFKLGIDPRYTTLIDPNGRPQYLVDHREPMKELV